MSRGLRQTLSRLVMPGVALAWLSMWACTSQGVTGTLLAAVEPVPQRISDPDAGLAFHVTPGMRRDLQRLLNQYKSIRLDSDADYRSGALPVLHISSDMRVEGGWNTRVPVMVIDAGASQVALINLRSDAASGPDVVFAGGAPINDVVIVGGTGGIGTQIHVRVQAGARLNAVRLSNFGALDVAQGQAGYIRNSTFSRLLGYWPGPHVSWVGNLVEPSGPNTFFAISSITPQKGSYWKDAGDLWLVNWDCESWNLHDHDQSQCFIVEGTGHVTSVGLSGGTAFPDRAGAIALFHQNDAVASWFFHGTGGRRDKADLLLRDVARASMIETSASARIDDDGGAHLATRFHLLDPTGSARAGEGTEQGVANWPAATVKRFEETVLAPPPNALQPVRRSVVDPLAAKRAQFGFMPDASRTIQQRIDREGVIHLPAGVYYLDRPLALGSAKRTEGILGDDQSTTYLVAKGDFPVIVGRGGFHAPVDAEAYLIYLALDRLTLYGGRYGIDWSSAPGNLGEGATVAFSSFTNLAFIGQRVAGVNADGIYGLDANSWYHDDFIDMPIAFHGSGHGTSGGMTYADKQSFISCQFQDISEVVWDWRSDRPSGGELWLDSYFYDVGEISRTRSATSMLWVNTVMENIDGPTAIEVTDRGDTASDYFYQFNSVWRGRGPRVVTDSQSFGLGSLFVGDLFDQTGGSLVGDRGKQSLYGFDSKISGTAQIGPVDRGLFIDSALQGFDQPLQIVSQGVSKTLIPAHGALTQTQRSQ